MDTYFQNMLHVSDMVAVIENVSSLTINFSLIPEILGGAYVELKEPDRWLNIDCPSTEEGCYLRCLEKFGIMLPQETLHTIRTELKIGHFVSSRQIEGMLKYIGTPLQVIIHNCKKDGTFANTHDSTKIPKIKPKDCATMHLGHIHNHFLNLCTTRTSRIEGTS